jgi:hypothetical protein
MYVDINMVEWLSRATSVPLDPQIRDFLTVYDSIDLPR